MVAHIWALIWRLIYSCFQIMATLFLVQHMVFAIAGLHQIRIDDFTERTQIEFYA